MENVIDDEDDNTFYLIEHRAFQSYRKSRHSLHTSIG